jgi:predicted small lipoprotein YifL
MATMKVASFQTLIGLCILLAACGQKGPLVLPDAEHPRKKIGVPTSKPPAPAPQTSAPQATAPQTPTQ